MGVENETVNGIVSEESVDISGQELIEKMGPSKDKKVKEKPIRTKKEKKAKPEKTKPEKIKREKADRSGGSGSGAAGVTAALEKIKTMKTPLFLEDLKDKNPIKLPLMVRLLVMSLGAIVLMTIVITAYARNSMETALKEESMEELQEVCVNIDACLNKVDPGDFHVEIGVLKKGDVALGEIPDFLDDFTKGNELQLSVYYRDARYLTTLKDKSGGRLTGTTCEREIAEKVLEKGEVYRTDSLDIDKQNYYAVYIPIVGQDGTVQGMVFAGKNSASINKMILKKTVGILLISILMMIIASVLVLISAKSIVAAVRDVEDNLNAVSKGKLVLQISDKTKKRGDEISQMATALERTVGKMRQVIGQIGMVTGDLLNAGTELEETAGQCSFTADEISNAVENISRGAVAQADDIETAIAQVAEMGEGITMIAESVGNLNRSADQMMDADEDAGKIILELEASNDRTNEAISECSDMVRATDESVKLIQEAVELITDIAEETNLLSLNASIEAARAGEAGRGFAVVASQIQKLADQSKASADRIAKIIKKLSDDSMSTVEMMGEMEDVVKQQQQKLQETKEKFSEVSREIQISLEEADQIRANTDTCNGSRARVVDVIQNLSAVSEENAATTQETTASMEELNATIALVAESAQGLKKIAQQLERNVRFFSVS